MNSCTMPAVDEASDETLPSDPKRPEQLARLQSSDPPPEFAEWASAVVTESSAAIEAEQPMALRHRPLESWTRLTIGETTTLTGSRATVGLLAEVRRLDAEQRAGRRLTPWLIGACVLLLAVIGALLLFR